MKLKTTASLILITLGMLSLQSICAQKVKDAESTKKTWIPTAVVPHLEAFALPEILEPTTRSPRRI